MLSRAFSGEFDAGYPLRVLTVADEFTRECVTVEVEYRMNAKFVAQTLLLFLSEGVHLGGGEEPFLARA